MIAKIRGIALIAIAWIEYSVNIVRSYREETIVTDEKKPLAKPAVKAPKLPTRPPMSKGPQSMGGKPQQGFGGGKGMMRKAGRGR